MSVLNSRAPLGADRPQFSRTAFNSLVGSYVPLSFEVVEATATRRFRVPTNNAFKNRDRFYKTLSVAFRHLPSVPFTVADFGAYPGSLLRLLRRFLPADACQMIGAGLMVTEEFRRAMCEECDAKILTVNLDPRNEQLAGKGYPTRVPLDDESVDFVFATEIVEHMVSPLHLFQEAFRVLRPGGHLLITTPNVTRIGNVFKLLIGRSNFDRLIPVDYWNEDDEWRPHFREYTMAEVAGFFKKAGFEVLEQHHFVGEDTHEAVKTIAQRLVDAAKLPFYAFPHFRPNLLAVGRKPVTSR